MNLYSEIKKLLSKNLYLQVELDELCKKYYISHEKLYGFINTIFQHNQLQSIDLGSDEKVYSSDYTDKDLFLSHFECLLNGNEIENILWIINNKRFNYDLSKIGIQCSSWEEMQLFIQSIIFQKIYSFLIINQDKYEIKKYLNNLIMVSDGAKTFEEILIQCDQLLLNSIINENKSTASDILRKIEKTYVREGYCFHGFNSRFEENILHNGLTGKQTCCDVNKMMSIDEILRNNKIYGSFQQNWDYQLHSNFFTTDNFAAAYYYSVLSPVFISRLVSNGKYMMEGEKYDRTAFFQRNVSACLDNVDNLLLEHCVSTLDKQYILKYLRDFLEDIFMSKDYLKIACFKRKNIKRDFSPNYDEALLSFDLPLDELVLLSIKPAFEIDRHENTLYAPNIIQTISIPNFAKSLIKKRN